jgi:ABC-type multidrug transport system permease subunit
VILGTAAFVGTGFLLTSAVRTSEAARGLAALVAFPMMFLGGIFVPLDVFPPILQAIVMGRGHLRHHLVAVPLGLTQSGRPTRWLLHCSHGVPAERRQ